jgi:hypothetical protein
MSTVLHEVQLAAELGFTEMSDFRAALRRQQLPQPQRFLDAKRKRRPVWTRQQIDAWLDPGRHEQSSIVDDFVAGERNA